MTLRDLEDRVSQKIFRRLNRRFSVRDRFAFTAPDRSFTQEDLTIFRRIRGHEQPPAIMLHGIMTRSGTVFATEVLRLHPDTNAFPKDIWEVPLLQSLDQMLPQQMQFFEAYQYNRGKLDDLIFLPLLGSAFVHYMNAFIPEGKTLLLKVPNVSYLDYFPFMFPFERCVVLMRDGRDIVQSTIATWKGRSFADTCWQWDTRARFLLRMRERYKDSQQFYFATYEAVQSDPETFVRGVFNHFGMSLRHYPFDQISTLPVRGSSTASVGTDDKVTWAPVEKSASFKPSAKWRDTWTEQQKAEFKKIAGDSLIRWGYADDNSW